MSRYFLLIGGLLKTFLLALLVVGGFLFVAYGILYLIVEVSVLYGLGALAVLVAVAVTVDEWL